jgi:autotransporter-associated beta strand protein
VGDTVVTGGSFLTTPAHVVGAIQVGAAGTFGVNLAAPATTLNAGNLTTDAGATLFLGTGAFGNPTAPILSVNTLTTAATTVRLGGTGLVPGASIPLIDYVTFASSINSFSVALPSRITGELVDNTVDGRVDLNITGVEQVRWDGSVNGIWDADPDGTGAVGTLNWRTTISNAATRYLQGTGGVDAVNFDDMAAGTTSVSLASALSPVSVNVANTTKTYTFSGLGRLTGATSLTKSGAGTLILAGSSIYDFTGGTNINEGTLQIGDGVTPGAGSLPTGVVTNNATITFNRPDDIGVANVIGGTGRITKENAGILTFSAAATNGHQYGVNGGILRFGAAATLTGPIAINSGSVVFNAGGNLSGAVTGAGTLESTAGTLLLSGGDVNTQPTTLISGGTVQLSKTPNVNAVGGNITVTGPGILAILSPEQIPDSATLSFLGTSGDPMLGTTAMETVANILVNPSAPTGQLVMRAGFTVTGLATLNSGVLGVGSSQTARLNEVQMVAGTILRIAGNGGPSTLNVGPGGIKASGGEIQVKFNVNNQDATLNLEGDFIATGNVLFTNAAYAGPNLSVINLIGNRAFDIADGTITTVDPDFGGTGGLIKSGGGILQLNLPSVAAYSGTTTVSAGVLDVRGSITGSDVVVNGTGMLAGTGPITTGAAGMSLSGSGKIAPGVLNAVGTLSVITAGAEMNISGAAQNSLMFDLADVNSSDRIVLTGGALNIGTGLLNFDDFAFNVLGPILPDTDYVLFDGAVPIVGTLGASLSGPIGSQIGTITFGDNGNDIILHIPEPGSAALLLGGLAVLAGRRKRAACV